MKSLKKLFAIALVLILSAMIALWILAKSVNPDILRNYISSHFSTLTHQKSEVDGDISWQLFPRPGIKVTNVRIGDDSKPSSYSAKLENLHFNLKITPLLRGKLIFSDLKVDGFTINVDTKAPAELTSYAEELPVYNEITTALPEQFAIENFLLSHGKINIVEEQRITTLTGLQVGGEQFNLQGRSFPFQFKGNFDLTKGSKKIFKAQVNFKGSTSLSSLIFTNPFVFLQNTNLDGVISLQNVKIHQLKLAKISAHAKAKPGVLSLNPLSIHLYDGESIGDLHYEYATKKLTLNQTATNLDSSQFIKDLINKALFKGSLDLSIHAQANLQNPNWQENLSGSGSFTIKNGLIESINLNKIIADTSDKINRLFNNQRMKKEHSLELGEFHNPEFFKGGTNFKLFTFQYQLKEANLQSNSLILQTNKLHLKGDGSLNLKNEGLNLNLFAKVTELDYGINKIQQLLGGSFPIQVLGSLTEPIASPDLQKINPILTKIWLKTKITKPVKTIGNTLQVILETGQQLL